MGAHDRLIRSARVFLVKLGSSQNTVLSSIYILFSGNLKTYKFGIWKLVHIYPIAFPINWFGRRPYKLWEEIAASSGTWMIPTTTDAPRNNKNDQHNPFKDWRNRFKMLTYLYSSNEFAFLEEVTNKSIIIINCYDLHLNCRSLEVPQHLKSFCPI